MLSWRVARTLPGILATTALAVGVLAPVPAQADGMQVVGEPSTAPAAEAPPAAAAKPAKVSQQSIPSRPSAEREPAPKRLAEGSPDATVVAELDADRLAPFSMLGVTWEGGLKDSATHVEVRWRSEGTWSDWTELHADPAPEEQGRSGTEPQWVGTADGAQVRVASAPDSAPKGLALSTIDPAVGEDPAGTQVDPAVDVTSVASVSKPAIISRSSWGASSSGSCDSPIYGSTTRGAVIHHTAGNNSYSRSQSAAIVKATQAFHMKSRKWCDIGYNFLVDKYGQIFEGRAGGVTKPVRAAHSGNLAVNKETMGVSLMGTFATVAPSAAMKSAVVDLVSWRFAQQGLKAKGTYSLGGLTLNRIAGHRNVVSTECPGAEAYGWLSAKGGLRDSVEERLANGSVSGTIAGRTVTDVTATGFTLAWTALSKAATYEVAVSTSQKTPAECADGCTSQKASSSPRAVVTGLTPGSTQYAWVRGVDSSGRPLTAWQSTPKTVKLVMAPAAKPSTVSGLTIKAGTHSARLRWPAVTGATSYDLCVVKDRADSSCYRYVSTLKDVTYLVKDLKPTAKTDYFVKLRAANGSAKSSWSVFKGFNLATSAPVASATTATVPSSGRVTVKGHGYGHGIGMSQYGAYGAAKQGIAYDKILARYYPGTKLGTKTGTIRVLVSQDTTDSVDIAGRAGLTFRKLSSGSTTSLPRSISGKTVTRWRIVQVSTNKTQSTLQYRTDGGWKTYKSIRWTGDGQFEGPSMIALVMPDGSLARYRGALRSALPSKGSTSRNTVNVLPIEDYVRGVVAAEMPSTWSTEALKAQSVAARTYGVRSMSGSRYYDICSTTSCQVYGGVARETARTDDAVAATKSKIVTYDGAPALTQFSSSSGGYTAAGSQPYLTAVSDPWDDFSGNPHHSWSTTVAATTVQRAYPSIGTLKSLKITKRTGQGDWGGRVATINLVGSSRTVTITGNDARWALGLKSAWFGF